MKRREVITMGIAAGCAARFPFSFPAGDSDAPEIANRRFRARFDSRSGLVEAWLADGSTFLRNACARARGPSFVCGSSDKKMLRRARIEKIRDALGTGAKIVAKCTDRERQITLGVEISLYEGFDALVLESTLRNDSDTPLVLEVLEPLRSIAEEGGLCTWPYASKSLTNGFLYADPGEVRDFTQTRNRPQKSVWNMGFASDPGDPGLTIGFLENDSSIGKIEAAVGSFRDTNGLSLQAEAQLSPGVLSRPRETARSGKFALVIAPTPFAALESYAQMVGQLHEVRLNPVLNGWCNWYYSHTNTSEAEILRNTEFAAQHLKPYGLEWIQIDDGYQRAFSDWEGNEKFPKGMKWLANKIRELGFRPGLWIAPYVVSEGTEIHSKHPDWLIHNLDGSLRHCGDRGKTKLYGLDISVPAARDWLRGTIRRITNDWGYDFIKIDFVEWTIFAAEKFADPTWSSAQAYRAGAKTIREAMGPGRHLLDCGPSEVAVGLFDSTRIELDQPFLTWQQYTGFFNSNAPAMAKRYYFHKRTWINDADHLGVALLSPSEAKAAASIIALSGGTMISGDRLPELDAMRLEIVQRVFPSCGEAARPIDLFERDKPEIFALPVKAPFEEWTVVGLFNYDESGVREKSVALSRLGLEAQATWLAFDFWEQKLRGEVRDELRFLVPAASVALLGLRRKTGVPQVLSTDRHFTQGAIELRDVLWDAAATTLRGTSLGGRGTHHHVFVYVPVGFELLTAPPAVSAYNLGSDAPDLPHDFDGYSVTLLPNGLARVSVHFDAVSEVSWRLPFRHA